MKSNTRSSYTISAATLNCIKQLLFSQDGEGVNLNPIVQDLGGDDLTAINVALAYKGVKPEIDTNPHYGGYSSYWKAYEKYKFVKYSLILDKVTVNSTEFTYVPETRSFTNKECGTKTFSLHEWLNLSDNPDKFIADIKEAKAAKKA